MDSILYICTRSHTNYCMLFVSQTEAHRATSAAWRRGTRFLQPVRSGWAAQPVSARFRASSFHRRGTQLPTDPYFYLTIRTIRNF